VAWGRLRTQFDASAHIRNVSLPSLGSFGCSSVRRKRAVLNRGSLKDHARPLQLAVSCFSIRKSFVAALRVLESARRAYCCPMLINSCFIPGTRILRATCQQYRFVTWFERFIVLATRDPYSYTLCNLVELLLVARFCWYNQSSPSYFHDGYPFSSDFQISTLIEIE